MGAVRTVVPAAIALAAGCGRIGFGPTVDVDEAVGAVSVGGGHTCTVLDGAVWCWGRNGEGQVGETTLSTQLVPFEVPDVTGATRVASGDNHTCALIPGVHARPGTGLSDLPGSITCWGYNGYLQLGFDREAGGAVALPSAFPDPQPVPGVPPFPLEVVAGYGHTCGRFEDGSVWCWGQNTHGEIGNGGMLDAGVLPVQITALTDVVQLAAGGETTCARQSSGRVLCWGQNDNGQLGIGSNADATTPTEVTGVSATALSVGTMHACALVDGGRYTCWGAGFDGRLGDGTQSSRNTPGAPSVGDGYVAIDAGGDFTCAVRASGEAACWGYAGDGRLGDGTEESKAAPSTVVDLTGAVGVSAGNENACAVRSDGAILCWGYGSYGELGDGRGAQPTPQHVPGLSAPVLTAGQDHTCAIAAGGNLSCWGLGGDGQLGADSFTSRSSPTPVTAAWGSGKRVQAAAAGAWHTCALLDDSSVWCWGYNEYGQLGTGDTSGVAAPAAVTGLGPGTTKAIAAGREFSCAVKTDSTVWCWGENGDGQLGDGTTTSQTTPVQVTQLTGVAVDEVVAGDHHACARAAGQVYCWGDNAYGQLGIGTNTDALPTLVPGLSVTAIAARGSHTCAIVAGDLWCWGSNGAGELGDGSDVDQSSPISIGLSGAVVMGLGTQSTCVASGGGVQCWGYNHYGELGTGTFLDTSTPTPVVLTGIPGAVSSIAAGDNHGCVAFTSGDIYCFGDNVTGELGLGTESRSLTAVPADL